MNQALDALLDLHEAAVVGDVGDLAEHTGAFRIAPRDVDPGILAHLLEAQGDTLALAVELEHLDLDLVADLHHLGGVLDAAPGHVGDVQQTVDAAQIDEGAVIGEVLDDTLDLHALLQLLEQRLALGAVLLFHHRAAGDHHVVALAVQLDDLELELLAFQVAGIAHRAHVHQGAGQKGADAAQVDREATLDLAVDHALDGIARLERLLQELPGRMTLGLFPRQAGGAEAVLDRVEGNLDLVADGDLEPALGVEKLVLGDDAFRLEARVNDHGVGGDVHHSAGDDGSGL